MIISYDVYSTYADIYCWIAPEYLITDQYTRNIWFVPGTLTPEDFQ